LRISRSLLHIIFSLIIFSLLLSKDFYNTPFAGFLVGVVSFNTGILINQIYLKNKGIAVSNLKVLFYSCLIPLYFYITYNFFDDLFFKKILDLFFYQFLFGAIVLIFAIKNLRILNLNFFQFLGKISYSIYLNHAIVIIVIPKVFFRLFNFQLNTINSWIVFILSLLIVILYSHFTYSKIESRFYKIK
jgi:peptidoglycan/LPS O-acetylase OafA/YrhL